MATEKKVGSIVPNQVNMEIAEAMLDNAEKFRFPLFAEYYWPRRSRTAARNRTLQIRWNDPIVDQESANECRTQGLLCFSYLCYTDFQIRLQRSASVRISGGDQRNYHGLRFYFPPFIFRGLVDGMRNSHLFYGKLASRFIILKVQQNH